MYSHNNKYQWGYKHQVTGQERLYGRWESTDDVFFARFEQCDREPKRSQVKSC